MGIVTDRVREQLRAEFEARLAGPVHLRLYTRPGSSRLILPTGVGCATCDDARQIAEALRDASPQKITLEVVDVSRNDGPPAAITEVPTIVVSAAGEDARIRFQGLPAGTEFPALIEAVERVSRNDHGLSTESLEQLEKLTIPLEAIVFGTPT